MPPQHDAYAFTDLIMQKWTALRAPVPCYCDTPTAMFNGSVLCCYLRAKGIVIRPNAVIIDEKGIDMPVLLACVNSIAKPDSPPRDAIVVHLRVGDVVDFSRHSVTEMLADYTYYYPNNIHSWNKYVMPLSFFAGLQIPPGETVVLGMATTKNAFKDTIRRKADGSLVPLSAGDPLKSCQYVDAVVKHFRRRGHPVVLRSGNVPDDDIAYYSRSSFFVPTGGSFSRLLAALVQRVGGVVLESADEGAIWGEGKAYGLTEAGDHYLGVQKSTAAHLARRSRLRLERQRAEANATAVPRRAKPLLSLRERARRAFGTGYRRGPGPVSGV